MNPSLKNIFEGVVIIVVGAVLIACGSAYLDIRSYNNRIEKIEQIQPKLSKILERIEISKDGEIHAKFDKFTYSNSTKSKDKTINELKEVINGLQKEILLLKNLNQ